MDAVGMDRLSLAAAQGEQGSEPHHADGDGYTARPFIHASPDWTRASGHPRTQSISLQLSRQYRKGPPVQNPVPDEYSCKWWLTLRRPGS